MYRRTIALLASLILALPLVTATFAQEPASPPASADAGHHDRVLSPESKHYGRTYGDWSARWWQWALAIPVHSPPFGDRIGHPLFDLTGARCGVGQSGPVWFL